MWSRLRTASDLRIWLVPLLIAAATRGGPACAADAVPMPTEWTQFRLNAQRDPVIAFPGAPNWTLQRHGAISSSPSVVGGTLYLGNNDGDLYALDVASGRVRWRYHAANPFMSDPLVYAGLVIVGEGNANSTTYVPRRKVQVGNGPNALIAIDAHTGHAVWRVPLHGSAMPTPVIIGGLLVEDDGNGELTAVEPHTGHLVYRRATRSVTSMVGLLPLPGALVVTAGIFPNRVFAVHAADGSLAWEYRIPERDSGVGDCPPASDGRRVFGDYVAAPSPHQEAGAGTVAVERVYALDRVTGRPLWNVALDRGTVPPRNESAIPLVFGNRLYVGSSVAPYVHAIDTATGRLVWRVKVGGPVLGGIVAKGNRIYFGDLAGRLWVLDAASGAVVGSLRTSTPFDVGSPIIVGDSLIIGSDNGVVWALPLTSLTAS